MKEVFKRIHPGHIFLDDTGMVPKALPLKTEGIRYKDVVRMQRQLTDIPLLGREPKRIRINPADYWRMVIALHPSTNSQGMLLYGIQVVQDKEVAEGDWLPDYD